MHTQHGFCVRDCQRLTGRIAGGAGSPGGAVFWVEVMQRPVLSDAFAGRSAAPVPTASGSCVILVLVCYFVVHLGTLAVFAGQGLRLVYHNEPPFCFPRTGLE